MSDHICPECGIPRTDILGEYCEACHEFMQNLGGPDAYLEWRGQFEEESPERDTPSIAEINTWAIEKYGYIP